VIPALGRWRQENGKFKANLSCTARPLLKEKEGRKEGRKEGKKEGGREGGKERRKKEKVFVLCIF
jgi:hypothetical protein